MWPRNSATARTSPPSALGRARHVQPLASGRLFEPDRAVDVAAHQSLDLEELVDRRVRDQADDHGTEPRSIASNASTMVGCVAVPPMPRVESAPHAFPISRHRPQRLAAEEAGEEARVERIARAGGVDELRRDRRRRSTNSPACAATAPCPAVLTTTVPAPAERSRAIASSITRDAGQAERLDLVRQEHVDLGKQREQPAVPHRRTDPSSDRSTSSPRPSRASVNSAGSSGIKRLAAGSTSSRGCGGCGSAGPRRSRTVADRRSCRRTSASRDPRGRTAPP